jgi:hypothetical protein
MTNLHHTAVPRRNVPPPHRLRIMVRKKACLERLIVADLGLLPDDDRVALNSGTD